MVHQKLLHQPTQSPDQGQAVRRRATHSAIKLLTNPLEEEMEPVKLYVQVVEGIPVSRAQWKSLLKSCLAKHLQKATTVTTTVTTAWTSTLTRRRPRT